jgi:hypothetical protein
LLPARSVNEPLVPLSQVNASLPGPATSVHAASTGELNSRNTEAGKKRAFGRVREDRVDRFMIAIPFYNSGEFILEQPPDRS